MISSAAPDPVKDALAWFILSDEVNSGGEEEDFNRHWLAGRRLALQFFASQEDLKIASDRHESRMNARQTWDEEMDILPDMASAHETMQAKQRIQDWALSPINSLAAGKSTVAF
jgi:hypothetical protein